MDRVKGVNTRPQLRTSPTMANFLYPRSKRWMTVWMLIDQGFHGLTYLAIVAFLIL